MSSYGVMCRHLTCISRQSLCWKLWYFSTKFSCSICPSRKNKNEKSDGITVENYFKCLIAKNETMWNVTIRNKIMSDLLFGSNPYFTLVNVHWSTQAELYCNLEIRAIRVIWNQTGRTLLQLVKKGNKSNIESNRPNFIATWKEGQ